LKPIKSAHKNPARSWPREGESGMTPPREVTTGRHNLYSISNGNFGRDSDPLCVSTGLITTRNGSAIGHYVRQISFCPQENPAQLQKAILLQYRRDLQQDQQQL